MLTTLREIFPPLIFITLIPIRLFAIYHHRCCIPAFGQALINRCWPLVKRDSVYGGVPAKLRVATRELERILKVCTE